MSDNEEVQTVDVKPAIILSEKEVIQNLDQGLRESASLAREMARAMQSPIWADISFIIDEMRVSCNDLANQKAISRMNALAMLERRSDAAAEKAKQ